MISLKENMFQMLLLNTKFYIDKCKDKIENLNNTSNNSKTK
jgi:hypothetical protein